MAEEEEVAAEMWKLGHLSTVRRSGASREAIPGLHGRSHSVAVLEQACAALASLVRMEYPVRYTLSEIAATWGEGISPEQLAALSEVDGLAVETRFEVGDDLLEPLQVEGSDVAD